MIFTQKRERVVFSKEERETIYIYDKLTNYMDIPDMPLDNNDTERLIRDMVMGKKAYILFFLSSGKISGQGGVVCFIDNSTGKLVKLRYNHH